jgi:hypothetical protein
VRDDFAVDEHARRVAASVLDALTAFDRGAVSVADVQASVASAAQALDHANVHLIELLNRLEPDLEEVRFAVPLDEQPAAVRERSAPVRRLLAAEG